MAQRKTIYYEDVELGDEIGRREKVITREAVVAFCRIWTETGANRFTDEHMAKEAGLPEPIVPGVMSTAIMAQALTDLSPGVVLKRLDVVFRQPVPHKPVVVTAVVTDKREENGQYLVECDIHMSNEDSGRLIGGNAIISVPSRLV